MMSTAKTSITQMGPRGLKELNTGPTMKIYFQPSPESEKVILSNMIPCKVGIAFSKAIEYHLQNQNTTSTVFTIISGDKLTITTILRWMMTRCNGLGLTPFEPQATFVETLSYLQTANDLEIPTLSSILYDRLQTRIRKPVIEDARAIYSLLDSKHPLRILFVKTISEYIRSRTLRNWGKFIEFAKQNEEYAMEVKQYRKILNAPQIEARRVARHKKNIAYWATVRAEQHEGYLVRNKDRAKAQEQWERTRTFARERVTDSKSNGKTLSDVTTKKRTNPVVTFRPEVPITLDLTKVRPTVTIGEVTKEIAPTASVDDPEEISLNASTDGPEEAVNVKVKDGKDSDDKDKEGRHLPITHKEKHKKD